MKARIISFMMLMVLGVTSISYACGTCCSGSVGTTESGETEEEGVAEE